MNSFKTRGTSMKIIRKPRQFNQIDNAIMNNCAASIARIVLTRQEMEDLYTEYHGDSIPLDNIDKVCRQKGYAVTIGDYFVIRGVCCQYEGE